MKSGKVWMIKSFILIILILGCGVLGVSYYYNKYLFFGLIPVVLLLVGYSVYRYVKLHRDVERYLKQISKHIGGEDVKNMMLLPMGVIITNSSREIIWYNEAVEEILNGDEFYGGKLDKITALSFKELSDNQGAIIEYNKMFFKAYHVASTQGEECLHMLYLIDITEHEKVFDKYFKTKPVVMTIVIDSYEEIIKNAKESDKTHVLSEVNRLLEKYIASANGFIQKYERDKYFAVVESYYYQEMIKTKFKILEQVKNIVTSEKIPVTLSIGVGSDGDTIEQNERDSKKALEMALGRGGDQVAVKVFDGYRFYGSASTSVEKRNKVKSRILASAMADLIKAADNVLIMGHRHADLDSLGAGIGMARACECMGKSVNIVLDKKLCLAGELVDYYCKFEDDGLFINEQDALELINRNTLLFIVDTHSPSFLESEKVYRECKNIVVIDHHRRMVDYIDNTLISYHETYASSASELVTELFSYFGEDCTLKSHHAGALLAGIMLDTKNFVMKTGVRTFEAAAYLKRNGADTVAVKKLFAGSMEEYRQKSKIVASAQPYKNCAIASGEGLISKVIAAQAADELLNIDNVDASFVIFEQKDAISVSARSLGNINVQVIMEKLGGGGHQTMAAAQIKNIPADKVKQMLIASIDEYCED